MKFYLFVAGLLVLTNGWTQQKEEQSSSYWSIALYYDQDYTLEQLHLTSLNEDRNYTMGLGIAITSPGFKKHFLYAPHQVLNKLFNKRFLNDRKNANDNITHSIMFGNGSFTPDSLPADYVIRNDRPYGSLTFFQTVITGVDPDLFRQYTTTFTIGLIGTPIAREIQTKIHKAMNENDTKNPRTPRGWNNQVSREGELTLAFTSEEERLLTRKHLREEQKTSIAGIELKHSWKYSIGYYTNLNYAFNFRLGKIDPRNWTYRVNALGGSNKLSKRSATSPANAMDPTTPADFEDYYEQKKTFELYVFGSLRPTFILYNALLNGQFRNSNHTLDFQDMRHLMLEFDAGGAISIPIHKRNLLEFRLRISGRSPEFKLPGRPPRWHYWGGIDLVFSHN